MARGKSRSEWGTFKAADFERLSRREILQLAENLTRLGTADVSPTTRLEREALRRLEALRCMEVVAEHLGLPEGQAPTTTQYSAVYSEFKSSNALTAGEREVENASLMHQSSVIRAFGRFRWAVAAYEGEKATMSPEAERLQARGRRGLSPQQLLDPLTGLRLWLEEGRPGTDGRTAESYERWARLHNETKPASDPRQARVSARVVTRQLQIDWSDATAVANGEMDLQRAQSRCLKRRLSETSELVGENEATAIAGVSDIRVIGMPNPVATLGNKVWLRSELRDHAKGIGRDPQPAYRFQHAYLTIEQIAGLLDMTVYAVRRRVRELDWARVPPPDGWVHRRPYWQRTTVETWGRDLDEQLARAAVENEALAHEWRTRLKRATVVTDGLAKAWEVRKPLAAELTRIQAELTRLQQLTDQDQFNEENAVTKIPFVLAKDEPPTPPHEPRPRVIDWSKLPDRPRPAEPKPEGTDPVADNPRAPSPRCDPSVRELTPPEPPKPEPKPKPKPEPKTKPKPETKPKPKASRKPRSTGQPLSPLGVAASLGFLQKPKRNRSAHESNPKKAEPDQDA